MLPDSVLRSHLEGWGFLRPKNKHLEHAPHLRCLRSTLESTVSGPRFPTVNGVPEATPPHWLWCSLFCQLLEGIGGGPVLGSARASQHPFFKADFLKTSTPTFLMGRPLGTLLSM